MIRIAAIALAALLAVIFVGRASAGDEEKVQLSITGGHQTDPRDRGRPVILIASALGVTAEIFREAFTQVKPAPAGTEPDAAQVRRNKTALLGALARYGVTNELLDRVSNYYRYVPGGDSLWPTAPATAYAIITDSAVTSIVVTDPGAGFSSPPKIGVPNHPEIALEATLAFGPDLKTNGSVSSIEKAPAANHRRD